MSRLVDNLRSYFHSADRDCLDDFTFASHCLCLLSICHSKKWGLSRSNELVLMMVCIQRLSICVTAAENSLRKYKCVRFFLGAQLYNKVHLRVDT